MSMEEEEPGYLPLFITEPVYLFDEDEPAQGIKISPAGTKVAEKPVSQPVVAESTEETYQKAPAEHVAEEKKEVEPVPRPAKPLPFQGKNEKSIVLAIDAPPNQEQRDLLKKIMASVNITGKDVAMTDVTSLQDPASLPPHTLLISFGVENPLLFKGKVPDPYEILKINHQSFVLADSLSVLYSDVSAKKNLWESLKKLFVA